MERGFLVEDTGKVRNESQPSNNDENSALSSDPSSGRLIMTDLGKALPEGVSLSPLPRKYVTMPHIPDGDGSTEWMVVGGSEERVMNTPGYPARLPKPRLPDIYEVRMTPDKGKGVFAKHNLRRGEIIFAERPLLIALNGMAILDLKCRFTVEESNQIVMFGHEKILEGALERMSETNKALYKDLHNSHTDEGAGPLFGILRTNGFGARQLSDSIRPFRYTCLCNLGSRLNHSCKPNAMGFFDVKTFSYQFLALRDIEAGEELCSRYCDVDKTKEERQVALAKYKFSCTCPACINATPETDNLRKTFRNQVARLSERGDQPHLMADTLSSAKALASQMVAEGLDVELDYLGLLSTIGGACHGIKDEELEWKRNVEEYCKIHVHQWPSLQEFLV